MAIYHCSIKIISRGKGKSAVAAAAYRAGELIKNEYDGITHDYTRKGGVIHTEILLPEHAPSKYKNRAVLWNAVEKVEKAKNSQLAREIELALPAELTRQQNISLVRDYVEQHFVSAGMCADICIHDKEGPGSPRNEVSWGGGGNPHAHILLTMRPLEPDGSWGAKAKKEYILNGSGEKILLKSGEYKTRKISAVDWNEQTKAEQWRAAWADAANTVLERQGITERIDHRSYERQGIEKIPTAHMGVAASQMEQKGIATERGDKNRGIMLKNSQLRQLQQRITHLKDWLKEALAPKAPPTLADMFQGILDGSNRRSRCGPKAAARALEFLQETSISTLSELRKKVAEMSSRLFDIQDTVKFYESRAKTLDEHIRQGEIYTKHEELYSQYQQLKPRKQSKFHDAHRVDLMLFESAQRYLDTHYIKPGFSTQSWKEEREKLAAVRSKVYREYTALKSEVFEVEAIRYAAEQITREATRNMNPPPQKDIREKAWER